MGRSEAVINNEREDGTSPSRPDAEIHWRFWFAALFFVISVLS